MTLFTFLKAAQNIKQVKIYHTRKENKVLYEGSYAEFAHKIHELGYTDCYVMRWQVGGDKVIIGIETRR